MHKRSQKVPSSCLASSDKYQEAFELLVSEIDDRLVKEHSVIGITKIRDRYREILKDLDVSNAMQYRSARLSKRMYKHYGSAIQIVPQKGRPSLVCSSDLTVKEMCGLAAKMQQESDEYSSETESDDENETTPRHKNVIENDTYAVAKHLRVQIKEKEKNFKKQKESDSVGLEQPESDNDRRKSTNNDSSGLVISYESASRNIPDVLYNLLGWMITETNEMVGDDGRVPLTKSQSERVMNIAQDIVCSITNIPMPKQIGLALHTLKQTGSKTLVRTFNKLGHCISYDNAQRYITTRVKEIDNEIDHNGIFVPSGLIQGQFLHCAFDNLDFHEDTKDGSTLHATSHNIYQYPEDHLSNKSAAKVSLDKVRERSVNEMEPFVVQRSSVSIQDRRMARSIQGISFPETETKGHFISDEHFVWSLLRQYLSKDELEHSSATHLSWNDFNEILSPAICPQTLIRYGPLFPSSPTDPSIVQKSLDYCITLTNRMQQETTVVTVDQAIYDIVKGIIHRHPGQYKSVVVKLGGFHIAENFLGSIGYLMKESGIEDILVNSSICQRGTANKVIGGKDYYKMVRYHSLLSEAMSGLLWDSFEKWLQSTVQADVLSALIPFIGKMNQALERNDTKESAKFLDCIKKELEKISPIWNDFVKDLGETARYWIMYVEMVHILKRYIHAERAGLWLNHLREVQNMLHFITSARHTKYMNCVPIYLNEMTNLPISHPVVYENFMRGNFAVHCTEGKFNGVWSDMALEQTYNKEGKTTLFKGLSQNPAARSKYIKTVPFLTSVSEGLKSMVDMKKSLAHHHGESRVQVVKDQETVEKIKQIICDQMINPFEISENGLLNISTGEKAMSGDLILAGAKGKEALENALKKGLSKIEPPNIITFASAKKAKPNKNQSLVKIYRDEASVTRILCFYKDGDAAMRQAAFSHEWTEYPTSLFDIGEKCLHGYVMRKGNKSEYISVLIDESEVQALPTLPEPLSSNIFIVDAMVFINRYQGMGSKNFAEYNKTFISKMYNLAPENCFCINIVGDRYDFGANSLKATERDRRGQDATQLREFNPSSNIQLPEWNLLMKNPDNKANLLNFIGNNLIDSSHILPNEPTLILGGMLQDGSQTLNITESQDLRQVLACREHEEADTRIFAHLYYCMKQFKLRQAVIYTTDTDVIVLALYHFPRLRDLDQLWIHRQDSYLPIHLIVQELARKFNQNPLDLTATLLTTYILSGCDSVSYPFRRGKRRAAKVSLELLGLIPHLSEYGDNLDISPTNQVLKDAKIFWAALYGDKDFTNLDTLRQHMFIASKSDLRSLPATEDAFYFHVLRALYQIIIYKRAHLNELSLPPILSFGRRLLGEMPFPVLMSKKPKPDIPAQVSCKCKSSRCMRGCSCKRAGVPCCITCACLGKRELCGRITPESDLSSEEDDSEA